ncbi:hypothetical protein HOY80DRAFT_1103785 [Tuber brumale]|nr:hypothetical protein HOY80DRAFT_1103785 [Tuber brumale]
MSQTSTIPSKWMAEETEVLMQWLEEPSNQRKTRKRSGITKRQVIKEMAAKILMKPEAKVGYKYDNLLKSYREAVKLNNQTGWGLSGKVLDEGKKSLQEKLLSQCPLFFHLNAIFGDHPNVRPLVQFDFSFNIREASSAVEKLLEAMAPVPVGNEISMEGGRKEGDRGEDEREDMDGVEEVGKWGDEGLVIGIEGEDRSELHNQGSFRRSKTPIKIDDDELVLLSRIREWEGEEKDREKTEEDGEESGRNLKKKKSGGLLVDAVMILASAKIEGEEKKFEFLNRHMLQQGELHHEELELKWEKLALKKEKVKAEQQRTELLMLQLRASMDTGTQLQSGIEYTPYI